MGKLHDPTFGPGNNELGQGVFCRKRSTEMQTAVTHTLWERLVLSTDRQYKRFSVAGDNFFGPWEFRR